MNSYPYQNDIYEIKNYKKRRLTYCILRYRQTPVTTIRSPRLTRHGFLITRSYSQNLPIFRIRWQENYLCFQLFPTYASKFKKKVVFQQNIQKMILEELVQVLQKRNELVTFEAIKLVRDEKSIDLFAWVPWVRSELQRTYTRETQICNGNAGNGLPDTCQVCKETD